jgi:heat shock protein HtpX
MDSLVTYEDLIAANKRRSALLVVGFVLFVTAVIMVLGLAIVAAVSPGAVNVIVGTQGLWVGGLAALVALAIALVGYYEGSQMILHVSGARPIQHDDDPELYHVVEEMAIAAGIPMPKVYVIDDSAPNAFATGRDPAHGIVCITTGLRHKLNREELQGVIAHEVAHIRNYDIRLMMLLAVLVGTVAMLSDFFWQVLRYGPRHRRGSRRDEGGAAHLILLLVAILLALFAPLGAQLIQLAVSREREYLADASAVELTRNPLGLASALAKIDADPDVLEVANQGTAHLFIANPIKRFEARAQTIFSSHPPIQERIRRLRMLAG